MPRYTGAYRDDKKRIRPITPRKRSKATTGLPLRMRTGTPMIDRPVVQRAYLQGDCYRRGYMREDPFAWSESNHLDDVPEKVWEYAYLNERSSEPERNPLRYIDVSNTKTPVLQEMRDNPAIFKKNKRVIYDIVLMSPDKYFDSISELRGFSSAREQRAAVTEKRAQEYAKSMRSGERFALPWIDYDYDGQEGRHRARALEILGVKFFPVMVVRGLD